MKHHQIISLVTGAALVAAPLLAFAQDAGVSADASVDASAQTSPDSEGGHPPQGALQARFGAFLKEHASGTPPRLPFGLGGPGPHASSTGMRPDPEKMQERKDKMASTSAARMDKAMQKGDDSIDKRIQSLTDLKARISSMTRLSADEKASLSANLDATIASLTALKDKIGSDTEKTDLKADVQSITKSYRVYALVLPQASVVAAANRIGTLVSQMQAFHAKLQARIDAAAAAGADTSAAVTALADFDAKVSAAAEAGTAASAGVANLAADNGDAAVAAANTAALKAARTKIQAAETDLKAARADIDMIMKALKGSGAKAEASGSASASTQ